MLCRPLGWVTSVMATREMQAAGPAEAAAMVLLPAVRLVYRLLLETGVAHAVQHPPGDDRRDLRRPSTPGPPGLKVDRDGSVTPPPMAGTLGTRGGCASGAPRVADRPRASGRRATPRARAGPPPRVRPICGHTAANHPALLRATRQPRRGWSPRHSGRSPDPTSKSRRLEKHRTRLGAASWTYEDPGGEEGPSLPVQPWPVGAPWRPSYPVIQVTTRAVVVSSASGVVEATGLRT